MTVLVSYWREGAKGNDEGKLLEATLQIYRATLQVHSVCGTHNVWIVVACPQAAGIRCEVAVDG